MIFKKIIAAPFRWYSNKTSHLITHLCVKLLNEQKIGYVDVGASGGLEPRWDAFKNIIKVFAFEPDQRSREKLVQTEQHIVFDKALSHSQGERNFYLCQTPQVSSMLKPNLNFLELFPRVERFNILKIISMEVSTLDQCLEKHNRDVDFIKLDTQGSELEILQGGRGVLEKSVLGIEIEIEFFQLYQDQPIFQDIVSFLKENGFQFIDFTNLQRWGRYEHSQVGQCVFCDGLFLRTPENFLNFLESLDSTTKTHKAAKYIAILAIYNRSDLINIFIEKGGQKFLSAQQLKHTESIINILKKNQRRIEYSVGLFNNLIKLIHPRLQLKIFI